MTPTGASNPQSHINAQGHQRTQPGATGASTANCSGSATPSQRQPSGKSSPTPTLLPAPTRPKVTWSEFLRSQAAVACDFATVDTALLRRFCLLFFIDVASRRVYFGGITQHHTGAWPPKRRGTCSCATATSSLGRVRSCATAAANSLSLRRDLQNRRLQGPQDTHPDAGRERVRRTLDRHPSTRTPRPHHHLEPPPTQEACRRLHRSLQHACLNSGRQHRRGWPPPSRENGPLWRTHQRVPKGRLTSHDTVFGTHVCPEGK